MDGMTPRVGSLSGALSDLLTLDLIYSPPVPGISSPDSASPPRLSAASVHRDTGRCAMPFTCHPSRLIVPALREARGRSRTSDHKQRGRALVESVPAPPFSPGQRPNGMGVEYDF